MNIVVIECIIPVPYPLWMFEGLVCYLSWNSACLLNVYIIFMVFHVFTCWSGTGFYFLQIILVLRISQLFVCLLFIRNSYQYHLSTVVVLFLLYTSLYSITFTGYNFENFFSFPGSVWIFEYNKDSSKTFFLRYCLCAIRLFWLFSPQTKLYLTNFVSNFAWIQCVWTYIIISNNIFACYWWTIDNYLLAVSHKLTLIFRPLSHLFPFGHATS